MIISVIAGMSVKFSYPLLTSLQQILGQALHLHHLELQVRKRRLRELSLLGLSNMLIIEPRFDPKSG